MPFKKLIRASYLLALTILIFITCRQPISADNKKFLAIIQDSVNLLYGISGRSDIILNKGFFIINYNDKWKIPDWVAYQLDTFELKGTVSRQAGKFKPDSSLPVGMRAELIDYENSGYDRGHMAPAGDFKRSRAAMLTTFLLSNICPQTPELNRKIWRKLEESVRKQVTLNGKAWIVTGNIFLGNDSNLVEPMQFIGPNKVAVPTHCFKVVLACKCDSIFTMYACMLPNQREPMFGQLTNFMLSVDRLEQITCYDFFPLLNDSIESLLESSKLN
ncbi:MAG: DNA/RNA non-specific endonuclease, partial [candidate division WOR-3 bacterium]|nr:DNA/RNA non-specific endonuclease [candidate division WOR-3 bacterium]